MKDDEDISKMDYMGSSLTGGIIKRLICPTHLMGHHFLSDCIATTPIKTDSFRGGSRKKGGKTKYIRR